MQALVFEHFSSNDHNGFSEDCSNTLIDKTDGSSIWVEHNRMIALSGQIISSNTYL